MNNSDRFARGMQLVYCKDCAHYYDVEKCPMCTLVLYDYESSYVRSKTYNYGFCDRGEEIGCKADD